MYSKLYSMLYIYKEAKLQTVTEYVANNLRV